MTKMRARNFLLLLITWLLAPTLCAASGPPPLPDIQARWIDAKGLVKPLPGKATAEWKWEGDKGPSLRITVHIYSPFNPIKLVLASPQGNQEIPFDSRVAELDARELTVSAVIQYSDSNGDKHEAGLHLTIQPKEGASPIWLHPTCVELGIAERPIPNSKVSPTLSKALFLGVQCELAGNQDPKTWNLRFFPSEGTVLSEGSFLKNSSKIPLPVPLPKKTYSLGTVGVQQVNGKNTDVHELVWSPLNTLEVWTYSAQAGLTYISYLETPHSVNLTQLGVTPKASIRYSLNSKFDLGLSSFVTLFPITYYSPNTTEWARFFGINLRGGYKLPRQWLHSDWKLNLGWYFWGMAVRRNVYGVAFLSGPQVFINFDRAQAMRPWSLYLKYAPTADSIRSLNVGNAEIAIGGALRVSPTSSRHRIDVTFDLSRTTLQSETLGQGMNLLSATLGAQYHFGGLPKKP